MVDRASISYIGHFQIQPNLRRILVVVPLLVGALLVLSAQAGVESFSAPEYPWGLAFDGTNIWISSTNDDHVTRLLAADGSPNGTFYSGGASRSLAFDGENIWIANLALANTLTVLRASDGALVATYPISTYTILFDGMNIWAGGLSGSSIGLLKIRPSDGTILLTVTIQPTINGLAYDGQNIWATQYYTNKVVKVRASDGEVRGTFDVGPFPWGAAFDGANIWIANVGDGSLTKLRANDGALVGTFPIAGSELIFDGKHLWAPDCLNSSVSRVRPTNGRIEGRFRVGNCPQGILFDGASVWTADFYSRRVDKLTGP
jgi:hypothetical protein